MKKMIVYLLVLGQILSYFLPISVYAKETYVEPLIENTEEQPKGNLEVDLEFVLPMKNMKDSNIEFVLSSDFGSYVLDFNGITESMSRKFQMGSVSGNVNIHKYNHFGHPINGENGDDVEFYAVTFYGLPVGSYDLEFRGIGYATKNIYGVKLDKYSKRVTVKNLYGGFTVGDVNSDEKINEKDLNDMSQFILEKKNYDVNYDLNRDQKVDISDLTMISHAIYGEKSEFEVKDTSVILKSDDLILSKDSTKVDGSITDLISGIAGVQIHPRTGEEISKENPAILSLELKEVTKMQEIRLDVSEENTPEEMEIVILDENNQEHVIEHSYTYSKDLHAFTDKATDNQIVIDLGEQIAVKKVSIRITKSSSHTLADISKVEFLNNVYEEVPDMTPEIPKNVKVESGSKQAIVSWDNMPNVTGYEVTLNKVLNGIDSFLERYTTVDTSLEIVELDNYTEYSVTVQAINGSWRGTPSDKIAFIPTPNRIPPAVENVSLKATSYGFDISYKKMKDTVSYNIYYRLETDKEFTKISGIEENSYSLKGLVQGKRYEIYITGTNELGEGPKSQTVAGIVKESTFPDMNQYRLINRAKGIGELTEHIRNVEYGINTGDASMEALVDHNLDTYWYVNTWDTGGYNLGHGGPKITFDKEYTMNYLDILPFDESCSIFYARVWYKDSEGHLVETKVHGHPQGITAPNGQKYYRITFDKVTTDYLEVNFANYSAGDLNISLREMYFYEYDSLEDDVDALFKDSLHVDLVDDVTESMIESLRTRANQVDSQNYSHPNKNAILSELDYALELLKDEKNAKEAAANETIEVDTSIFYNNDTQLGFAYNTSDLQPLGVAVQDGDEIIVYVGSSDNRVPYLVVTQYYAEASAWQKSYPLKAGRNVIKIEGLTDSIDAPQGGALYVQFPYSNAASTKASVRVRGGTKIPVLDIHKATTEEEITEKIKTYVEELTQYVIKFRSDYPGVNERLAVLNSTDIVTKYGMYSVAATATYDALKIKSKTIDGQVSTLQNSLKAFDEMMELFYRQKGLVNDYSDKNNRYPTSRINIRYMRMFDGAFMYAGGAHIGIEYDSIAGLMQGTPAKETNGVVDTSGYFGWGISHEIGHQINHRTIAVAEVTNNVYSLLAQTADDVDASRLEAQFDNIYQKVTSNTKGKAANVFTTLGMYWQLHLAYDDNKTFGDTDSIYARMNTLLRNKTYTGTKDDILIQVASEAANKNLISFFEAWGLTPSEETKAYVSSFEEETREIRYLNDEARRYRLSGGEGISSNITVTAQIAEADSQNKRFTLNFEVSGEENKILGYEIKRNGVVIGFTTEKTFTDHVGTLNNRALHYEVTAYDKLLNKTNTYSLEEVKVSHDGSISKAGFDILSNYIYSDGMNVELFDPENEKMDYKALKVNQLIDGNIETVFEGNTLILGDEYKGSPYVIIDMNSNMSIAGLKYVSGGTHPIQKYEIYVSQDREHWTLAKTGEFTSGENIVYFDKEGTTGGNQLWTYHDIGYVKVVSTSDTSGISGAEIDIIAPPGDNIELSEVSKLKEDYHYDKTNPKAVIPAGSVLFRGNYRGNPAFNVGLIADANVNLENGDYSTDVYDGDFFAFASLNSEGNVYEIADGTWMFAMTPEEYEKVVGKDVRAVLFRVNDAETNEGERVTSTSMKTHLPSYESLTESIIEGGN